MPPLGSVIELNDSDTDEDEDHDLDNAVANAVNGASSSVESPSKKQRTSEAEEVVLPVVFVTPLPLMPVSAPTLMLSLPAMEYASNSPASRTNASKSLSLNSSKQF